MNLLNQPGLLPTTLGHPMCVAAASGDGAWESALGTSTKIHRRRRRPSGWQTGFMNAAPVKSTTYTAQRLILHFAQYFHVLLPFSFQEQKITPPSWPVVVVVAKMNDACQVLRKGWTNSRLTMWSSSTMCCARGVAGEF